jgi:polyphosphate glucokinase
VAPDQPAANDEPAEPDGTEAGSRRPYTLAFDVGGTGLKASVLDAAGAMVAPRAKVPTRYPLSPDGERGLVARLAQMAVSLPKADRVSVGFPGMVRQGVVLSAPHFVTVKGPGSAVDPELVRAWSRFPLAEALGEAVGLPARAANDADIQGAAVVAGKGLELVITLGTGVGTAAFMDGTLLPHMEFAHHPFRKDETYNEQLGETTRKKIGDRRWNRRVRQAVANLDALFFFDHLYIGGGNSRRVVRDELGDVLERTTVVDNTAGLLGGIRLWDSQHPSV